MARTGVQPAVANEICRTIAGAHRGGGGSAFWCLDPCVRSSSSDGATELAEARFRFGEAAVSDSKTALARIRTLRGESEPASRPKSASERSRRSSGTSTRRSSLPLQPRRPSSLQGTARPLT